MADELDEMIARDLGGNPLDAMIRRDLGRDSTAPNGWQELGRVGEYRILQYPDGTLHAVGSGIATSDPAEVELILDGAPDELVFAARRERWQAEIDQQRIAQNPIAARANEIIRGIPFVGSYTDEAVGVFSPQARDNMRATTGAMQRQRPGQTAALNMTGAVAGSIPLAIAAAPSLAGAVPATRGGQALAGLLGGATAGAVEGSIYQAGEGTTGNRAARATEGALLGGGVGAALGVSLPFVGAGLRNVLQRLQGSDVQVIGQTLGISPVAARQVKTALTNADFEAAEAALRRAGPSAMLADASVASSDLLDAVAQGGGASSQLVRSAVTDRTQAASRQITSALDDVLGPPRGHLDIIDEIRNGTAPQRSAAYEAAYAAPINYAEGAGQNIEALLPRIPASAWRRAEQLMRLEGVESAQRLVRIDGDRVTVSRLPDVRELDYITRALNDVAKEADGQGALGGTTDLGRLTANLSRVLRANMRDAVPEYATALETAADAISRRQAAETGYNMFAARMTREDVARALADATGPEREAAREGLRAYIDDTMARVTRTMGNPDTETQEGIRALRDISSRANQTKLRILLGQDTADRLLERVDEAATAFELRAAIAVGSRTRVRTTIQNEINAAADGGIVRTLAAGEPIDATKRLTQALTGETAEARQLRRMGLYEEVARALVEQRGDRARTALRVIRSAIEQQSDLSQSQARLVTEVLVGGGLVADRGAATLLARPENVR